MVASLANVPAVDAAHRVLDLTYQQVASIRRVDERRLDGWRSGKSVPTPVFLHRLKSLDELLREFRTTFRTTRAARVWLRTRVPAFHDRRPLDLLLDGRIGRLTAALQALNAGVTA
jgi:uncharacterized protein (DUF2384 family)